MNNMMRRLLLVLLLGISYTAYAQQYGNEWIDYNKTYYKFKVGSTGLYRIAQTALPAAIANVPAEQFQLWRNGKQVPLYTSVASGSLPGSGYIEFWGERNDGVFDKALYLDGNYQVSDRVSLQTDTAAFFLTVNTTVAANLRYSTEVNNVAGNTLPAEPYLLYTKRYDFQEQIAHGLGYNFGERVTSSSYDLGEFWGTRDIGYYTPYTITTENLYPASSGPAASINLIAGGVSYLNREVRLRMNGGSNFIIQQTLPSQNVQTFSTTVPVSSINASSGNNFVIEVQPSTVLGDTGVNRITVPVFTVTYPRLFNFGGQTNFTFNLPVSTQGNFLQVTNFNGGSSTPVLYDLTNNRRYVANTSIAGTLQFALPSSAVQRNFVLVSQDATHTVAVNNFVQRSFTDYRNNPGNYLVISNKVLFNNVNDNSNPVVKYVQYRSSAAGGNYAARLYDVEDLVDQFGYGIKKHPLAIKNFLSFAKQYFTSTPTHVFLVGKGVTYDNYRINQSAAEIENLNLVPTWGWPASDILMVSPGVTPAPMVMVGRLSAVKQEEVGWYLEKVQEYEAAVSKPQTIADKAWMKRIIHVAGQNDANLESLFTNTLQSWGDIAKDTFWGARIFPFNKAATGGASPAVNAYMATLLEEGVGMITYYGHSASTTLDYSLNDPTDYHNQGKYPLFMVNGCNAGNFFDYDVSRLNVISSIAEKFVLTKQKGVIGFIASTHYGITSYLDIYSNAFYRSFAKTAYNTFVGRNMQDAISAMGSANPTSRMHGEQITLHGDPAIKIYAHNKPDFVIEEPQIITNPSVITVADTKFNLKVRLYNIGKAISSHNAATGDSVRVLIKWQHGNGVTDTLVYKRILSIRNMDSIIMDVPVNGARDAGNNCISVTIDNDGVYDELSETNNSVNKCFVVFTNDLRPVYPYNYSIVRTATSKVYASTADPLIGSQQYVMEMDTTNLFNSAAKVTRTVTSAGGVIEFDPQVTYKDSTVYYWRAAPVPASGNYSWNYSSFVYLANATEGGFNQSHYYQHLQSTLDHMVLNNAREWKFSDRQASFWIRQGIYGGASYNEDADLSVSVDGTMVITSGCMGSSLRASLFEPVTLKPVYNQSIPDTAEVAGGALGGFMGSAATCSGISPRKWNFEYTYLTAAGRQAFSDFLNWIPNGYIVVIRINLDAPFNTMPLVNDWKNDPGFGNGTTLYERLKAAGFTGIDQFTYPRSWSFIYQKGAVSFTPEWNLNNGISDPLPSQITKIITVPDTSGKVFSPSFGPAARWKQMKWRGSSKEALSTDVASVNIIGITATGTETVLFTNVTQPDFDISSVSATTYPYLRLQLNNEDKKNLSPYQLRYWRLIADMLPEGAIAPNIKYSFATNSKDTLDPGEPLNISVAFKNVSDLPFPDSLAVKLQLLDRNNVLHTVGQLKLKKPLAPGDTATLNTTINTAAYPGANTLTVDFNPDNNQPEQYHFNNYLYKAFYVRTDNINPIVDVTFDGVHILNGDIVSSKPAIHIKLKDESKYLALDDTSTIALQLVMPDNSVRKFKYGTDTLKFTPASVNSSENAATVDFTPLLTEDGEYELVVQGKDKTGNASGTNEYRVAFSVYNKPMISEVFNYPNPFTSSTAFVFTLTGSKLPSNIRIQILTVTGKIVKEINKDELGPIHIGRNITDYKWDGTDQYGQKLGNGVYLYRIITNMEGNSLERFELKDASGDKVDTGKFFKGGYGKMYLMR